MNELNLSKRPKYFLWLDLETTGLDPCNGEILEIGGFLSTFNGEIVKNSAFSEVLTYQREYLLHKMDDYVLHMHLYNKLLPKVWSHPGCSAADSEISNTRKINYISDKLKKCVQDEKMHLAGNSIHFDYNWLMMKYPRFISKLNIPHRLLDVSSFLLIKPYVKEIVGTQHRALDDAKESYLMFYKNFYGDLVNDNTEPNHLLDTYDENTGKCLFFKDNVDADLQPEYVPAK